MRKLQEVINCPSVRRNNVLQSIKIASNETNFKSFLHFLQLILKNFDSEKIEKFYEKESISFEVLYVL